MPNPPSLIGTGPIFAWGNATTYQTSTTFTVSSVPAGSLILLGAAVEFGTSYTQAFITAPTPGAWTTIFSYAPPSWRTGVYTCIAFMFKWADTNDASSTGQTYTITVGDARNINTATNRVSHGQLYYWSNVNNTTPIVFLTGQFLLPTGAQSVPALSSVVPSVVFGYWIFQVSTSSIPEDQTFPPTPAGWSSSATAASHMVFFYHTTPGDSVFPGVSYTVNSNSYYPGIGYGFLLVPSGPPYPTANPNPSLTRSRAVPLAIAGPRLNEVTAAYKPVIRVY